MPTIDEFLDAPPSKDKIDSFLDAPSQKGDRIDTYLDEPAAPMKTALPSRSAKEGTFLSPERPQGGMIDSALKAVFGESPEVPPSAESSDLLRSQVNTAAMREQYQKMLEGGRHPVNAAIDIALQPLSQPIGPVIPRFKGGMAAGVGNVGLNVLDFLRSPLGVGTLGLGSAATPLLMAEAGRNIPQTVGTVKQAFKGGDTQAKTEAVLGAGLQGLMLGYPLIKAMYLKSAGLDNPLVTMGKTAEAPIGAEVVKEPLRTNLLPPESPELKAIPEKVPSPPTTREEPLPPEQKLLTEGERQLPATLPKEGEGAPPARIEPPTVEAEPVGQPAPRTPSESATINFQLPRGIRPEIKSVPDKELQDAFKNFYDSYDTHYGPINEILHEADKSFKVENPLRLLGVKNPWEYVKADNEHLQAARQYMEGIMDGYIPPVQLDKEASHIVKTVWDKMYDIALRTHTRPGMRPIEATGQYYPGANMFAVKVMRTLAQGGEAARAIEQRITQWNATKGKTPEETMGQLRAWRESTMNPTAALHYGPLDMPAGFSVPPEFREPNLMTAIARYGSNAARRLAYYDSIESRPGIEDKLYGPGGLAKEDATMRVLEDISGRRSMRSDWLNGISQNIRTAMLGTVTGAKDFTMSATTRGLTLSTPPQYVNAMSYALTHLGESFTRGIQENVIRPRVSTLESGPGSLEQANAVLRRFADVSNAMQARNLLEMGGRTLDMGKMMFLSIDNSARYLRGERTPQTMQYINAYMPEAIGYLDRGEAPPERILQKGAARAVQDIQGSYDYRELPAMSIDPKVGGPMPWILSLNRWNIGQMNRFMDNVVNPLLNGNVEPALMATLGMVLGGAAITELVEASSGYKDKAPTWKELAYAGGQSYNGIPAIGYKLAVLSDYAGYAGLLGSLAHAGFNAKYGDPAQTIGAPLLEFGKNVGERGAQLAEALEKGESPDVWLDFIAQTMIDSSQGTRLLLNNLSSERQEQIHERNLARDQKMASALQGLPVMKTDTGMANPFMEREAKKYRREQDIGKAMTHLGPAISQITKGFEGDVPALKSKISALGNMPDIVMPSTNRPLMRAKYFDFINQTQGPQALGRLLTEEALRAKQSQVKRNVVKNVRVR